MFLELLMKALSDLYSTSVFEEYYDEIFFRTLLLHFTDKTEVLSVSPF